LRISGIVEGYSEAARGRPNFTVLIDADVDVRTNAK
jgi:hypothetical protein